MANVSSSNGLEKYPKLRFKGFSEPWKTDTLGNLGTFIKGAPLSKADITDEGTPFVLYGELYTTYGEVTHSIKRRTDKVVEPQFYSKVGDVIMPTSGETPEDIATASCIMLPDVILAGDLLIYRTQKVDGRLVSFVVKNKVNKQISSVAQGKSVVHVRAEELSKITLSYPSDAEQQKILTMLELIEDKIAKQRELIEHLKKYKRGALQHIFHKMTECSIVTVGDVFTKANKRNSDGRVKNVITNSAEYGLIPQRDFFDKDIAVDGNTNNYFIIKKGCFVYNPRKSNTAPYGPFNCYQGEEEGIISPLYTCLVKKADVDSTYLSWYFKSDSWYRYIYDNGSQGVRHDRVSMTDDLLMGIPIKLPNDAKQKEIGAFFDAIDAKLKCEADILNALIKIKNGLYDKMFI